MQCPKCGNYVDDEWSFCPACGSQISRQKENVDEFNSIFSGMKREIEKMNDMFEKNFEVFDMRPFFTKKTPRSKGFTMRITTKNGEKPDVTVKTFGDIDPRTVQRNVTDCMGCEPRKVEPQIPAENIDNPPKVTEEPDSDVKRMGDSVVIEVKLPGVKSLDNIKVHDLESSVEVRARAGEKGFFKILTKPEDFKLVNKRFSGELLFLEFK